MNGSSGRSRLWIQWLVASFLSTALAAAAAPFAYIPNSGDDTLSVIDLASDTVVKTLRVGGTPRAVAVNNKGTRAYVANAQDASVSVIDAVGNHVLTTVPTGLRPFGLAVDPADRYLYVAGILPLPDGPPPSRIDSTKTEHFISVRDAQTLAEVSRVPLGTGEVFGPVVSTDGAKLYVMTGGYRMAVIDTRTFSVTNPAVDVQAGGLGFVAFSPTAARAYVAGSSGLLTIDSNEDRALSSRTNLGGCGRSSGLALDPYGDRAYVSLDGGCLLIIDLPTQTVTARLKVGGVPWGVALSPDGGRIYVVNEYSNSVSVVDAKSQTVVSTIAVGARPLGGGQFIQPAAPHKVAGMFSAFIHSTWAELIGACSFLLVALYWLYRRS